MPLPDLYILAAGNPGIVKILEPIQRSGPRFASVSILDDDESRWGEDFLGYPIVGGTSVLEGRDPVRTVILNNVARDTRIRAIVTEKLAATGLPFCTMIHPTVDASHVKIGDDVQVGEGAILGANAELGDHCLVRNGSIVNHDCVLEENVFVGPGVSLASRIHVGRDAFLGTGASVVPDIRIGPRATVGAGAVVIRDVPAGATVVGNPSRVVRRRAGR